MVNLLVRGAVASVLAIGLAAGLGACNTMEGFGKDMSAAGRALSNSAERNKGGSSASNTSGAAESTSSTASASPASGSPTPISPGAGSSSATSSSAPVSPVTPVN